MDTPGPGSAGTDEQKVRIQPGILSSGAEMAAQNPSHASAYSEEKQVGSSYYSDLQSVNNGLGYSDLEAVEPAGLEVAGSDGSQTHYLPAPKFDEHQGRFSPSTHATQDPFSAQAPPPDRRRIWGMRRRMFWIVLGVVLFGVLLALGVGIGVGVGLGSGGDAGSASATSSTPTATSTSSSSDATTDTLPAAVATYTATATTSITCPAANRTLYDVAAVSSSASKKKFLVLCGRDYSSSGGAVDLSSMNMTTFAGCVAECGLTEGCVAVGWGTYYDVPTCWLKSTVGTPNWSAGWYSAVENDEG